MVDRQCRAAALKSAFRRPALRPSTTERYVEVSIQLGPWGRGDACGKWGGGMRVENGPAATDFTWCSLFVNAVSME